MKFYRREREIFALRKILAGGKSQLIAEVFVEPTDDAEVPHLYLVAGAHPQYVGCRIEYARLFPPMI